MLVMFPVYFNQTSSDAYDGQSWWCADAGVGGYLDGWVQVLQSPTINVPAAGNLSAMMKWGIEDLLVLLLVEHVLMDGMLQM